SRATGFVSGILLPTLVCTLSTFVRRPRRARSDHRHPKKRALVLWQRAQRVPCPLLCGEDPDLLGICRKEPSTSRGQGNCVAGADAVAAADPEPGTLLALSLGWSRGGRLIHPPPVGLVPRVTPEDLPGPKGGTAAACVVSSGGKVSFGNHREP